MYRVVRDQSHALVDHLRGRLVGAFRPDPELPCHRRKTTPLLSGTRRFDGGIELYYFNVECSFRNGIEDVIYIDHLRDRLVVLRQGVETTVTRM